MEYSMKMAPVIAGSKNDPADNPDLRLVEVRDLTVRYGSLTAVSGVTFHVKPGEIFGLLGPNGAGKTSILSAIEGLLQPSSGTVRVAGFDIRMPT